MVIRSFVGARCGPRIPTFLRSDAGMASPAGLNFSRSATVSSRTSPFASTSCLDLGIPGYLSGVCLAKTDDTYAIVRLGKAENMETTADRAYANVPDLAIVAAVVHENERLLEVELCNAFERRTPVADVPLVLPGIKANAHPVDCTYNLIQALRGPDSAAWRRTSLALTLALSRREREPSAVRGAALPRQAQSVSRSSSVRATTFVARRRSSSTRCSSARLALDSSTVRGPAP